MGSIESVWTVGIAGGSGSGKSTLAKMIVEELGQSQCSVLCQDHYYIDQSAVFRGDGENVNFDHPASLDWPLLSSHLSRLKDGETIEVPIYDFASHRRLSQTQPFPPRRVVLLDGILILTQESVTRYLDYRIFVDTPEEVRFARRLARDTRERGRTEEGVRKQFFNHVKPMHDQFVEPSRLAADLVVMETEKALEKFLSLFRALSSKKSG